MDAPWARAPRGPAPAAAAWEHRGLRVGFETLFLHRRAGGVLLSGCTAAVEAGTPWATRYDITVDEHWTTRRAHVVALTESGSRSLTLETGGHGSWSVDGRAAPWVEGCLDVDLETSGVTNTLPIRRLSLAVGEKRSVPAAYVRAATLEVQRLEQTYERLPDDPPAARFLYRAPAFGFECELVVDSAGLVLDYPGIAARVL